MAQEKQRPTDQEILDFIWPILRTGKLDEDQTLTVTHEKALQAVVRQWPDMGIRAARRRVTRLRIL